MERSATDWEVSRAVHHDQAATRLGLSRPTLTKLIEAGEIDHVKVGAHHRVPAQAILEFQRAHSMRPGKAAKALAEFSSEIGLVD